MSFSYAHYSYQAPNYHNYACCGFTYRFSSGWFVMDDFGDAVRSDLFYSAD